MNQLFTISPRHNFIGPAQVVYTVAEGEVVGLQDGEEIQFSRVIGATGTSSYRLDNKEVGTRLPACLSARRELPRLVHARPVLTLRPPKL